MNGRVVWDQRGTPMNSGLSGAVDRLRRRRGRDSRDQGDVESALGALTDHLNETMEPGDADRACELVADLLKAIGAGNSDEGEGEGEGGGWRDPALTPAMDRRPRLGMGLDAGLSGGPARQQRRAGAVVLAGHVAPRSAGSVR
jgi:hypothetical protein